MGLGHAPGPLLHHQLHQHFPQNTRKDSPSRQRRRARRAASRKQQAEKAKEDNKIEAAEANSNDSVNHSENLDVENIEVLNEHSDVQDRPIKTINDEFCPDEDYHEVDNVGMTPLDVTSAECYFCPRTTKKETELRPLSHAGGTLVCLNVNIVLLSWLV